MKNIFLTIKQKSKDLIYNKSFILNCLSIFFLSVLLYVYLSLYSLDIASFSFIFSFLVPNIGAVVAAGIAAAATIKVTNGTAPVKRLAITGAGSLLVQLN